MGSARSPRVPSSQTTRRYSPARQRQAILELERRAGRPRASSEALTELTETQSGIRSRVAGWRDRLMPHHDGSRGFSFLGTSQEQPPSPRTPLPSSSSTPEVSSEPSSETWIGSVPTVSTYRGAEETEEASTNDPAEAPISTTYVRNVCILNGIPIAPFFHSKIVRPDDSLSRSIFLALLFSSSRHWWHSERCFLFGESRTRRSC